jgi:hypothetical protein
MTKPERTGRHKYFYKYYKEEMKGKVNFDTYTDILVDFNMYCMKEMIENARVLNMGDQVGNMFVACIWRNFNRRVVNWGETNKRRANGEKVMIYYTDDYSLKFMWRKGKFRGKSLYKFMPTQGSKGNMQYMLRYNRDNPLMYKQYAQINK